MLFDFTHRIECHQIHVMEVISFQGPSQPTTYSSKGSVRLL